MSDSSKAYDLYRLLWSGLDLLFPPVCGGCGRSGVRWCADCQQNVPRLCPPLCHLCGIPLNGMKDLCADCLRAPPRFRSLRSWCAFDAPIRNALLRLKYRRDIGLGDALASQLLDFAGSLHWPFDLVVPVPLGQKRLKERGYNQVGLIARPLSLAMGIAYTPDALSRVRETRSQVGLTKIERQTNIRKAFEAKEMRVRGRVVLLMDDVATTGSTLSSCTEALYAAGARDVFALTVARALARHGLNGA